VNLWALKRHKIISELGYSPPTSEIHTYKYEHEKACADMFVTLALSGKLTDWQAHKKIGQIIPDRMAELDRLVYIEVEMGSKDEIKQKAEAYRQYYFDSREQFEVWFVVKTQEQLDKAEKDLDGFSSYYRVDLLSNFVPNNVPNSSSSESNQINS
jgi:hypothetical protein